MKNWKTEIYSLKSLWRTVRFATWKDFPLFADFWLRTTFPVGQFLADFKGKDFWLLALRLRQLRTESIEKYKTADKNRFWLLDFSHLRAESAFRLREKKSKTWLAGRSETNSVCTNRKLSDWKLYLEWKIHRKVLTNIILTDRNLKIIALICRLLFRDLREKKRLFIFGQTLFVSGLKVHLDTELKIGLREKAHLIGRN